METINLATLENVTGGTLKAASHFVTSLANRGGAIMQVNIAKGGKKAYVKDLYDGSVTTLTRAPKGTKAL